MVTISRNFYSFISCANLQFCMKLIIIRYIHTLFCKYLIEARERETKESAKVKKNLSLEPHF